MSSLFFSLLEFPKNVPTSEGLQLDRTMFLKWKLLFILAVLGTILTIIFSKWKKFPVVWQYWNLPCYHTFWTVVYSIFSSGTLGLGPDLSVLHAFFLGYPFAAFGRKITGKSWLYHFRLWQVQRRSPFIPILTSASVVLIVHFSWWKRPKDTRQRFIWA